MEQNFQKKIVPGTKSFTENFVPPEQNFPEQNSSDRSHSSIGSFGHPVLMTSVELNCPGWSWASSSSDWKHGYFVNCLAMLYDRAL